MTRDMALSWRIGKFIKEVSHDCHVINSSVRARRKRGRERERERGGVGGLAKE
jgi:hypothetical protein